MIDELIKEIEISLDSGCVISALTTALILPDLCAKAMYSKLSGRNHTNKERYVKWYEENIGQYERNLFGDNNNAYLSGELVYSLRCSLLHEGNPNIDNDTYGIDYFELIYQKVQGSSMISYSSEARLIKDADGNNKEVNKKISVNVRDLCQMICLLAKNCYEENKDKFNFFNYNLVDVDFQTRKSFGIRKEDIIK